MRASILIVFTAGCFQLSANMRPAVIPKLSELPPEAQRRNGVLDSATTTPGPEQRKGQTPRMRKAETAAATAAAVIGVLFSKSSNVTLGGASTFDENEVFEHRQKAQHEGEEAKAANAAEPAPDATTLVPWVRLN